MNPPPQLLKALRGLPAESRRIAAQELAGASATRLERWKRISCEHRATWWERRVEAERQYYAWLWAIVDDPAIVWEDGHGRDISDRASAAGGI